MSTFENKLIEKYQERHWSLSLKIATREYIDELMRFIFPHFAEKKYFTSAEIDAKLSLLKRDLRVILDSFNTDNVIDTEYVSKMFIEELPSIFDSLYADAEAINAGDPASENVDEVILAYPGFFAIALYRFAHVFYLLKVPIFPRLITEYAHQTTGIDIHPGAKIGNAFCIDHGTGIVIGETSELGNNVKIYQGVTLGALSVNKKAASKKRHPTIEDNVVIYAQAVILGGDTVIGHDSVIGGNSWITSSVNPFSLVYNKSEVGIRNMISNDYQDFCI